MAVTTTNQWHKRLGHPSNKKLSHISLCKDFSSNSKEAFCDSCLRAKLTRLPFPTSTIKTNDCFEMIHCDIWGGYRTFSLTHGSYFLTIVDDYSRAVWVYIIRHKYEAIYDLEKRKIVVSRDVKFFENVFPFSSHKENVNQVENEIVGESQPTDGPGIDMESDLYHKENPSASIVTEEADDMDSAMQSNEPNNPPEDMT
uniref:GAG-pre-integrase domain-containing protein n=1 Tax=Lactuca sativa TaxID=4236 RepID=A0A9R1WNQ8_LACSA|nr:hypothetical protein LSAT_V11C100016210 [Lactuca sativa]